MIKKMKPTYVHALFAGQEAVDFLEIYANSTISKEIPLLITSHMGSKEILENVQSQDLEFYCSSVWNETYENAENRSFVNSFRQNFGETPNTFNLLGYEVGMAISELHDHIKNKEWLKINQLLNNSHMRTPRGEKLFSWATSDSSKSISIEKVFGANKVFNRLQIDRVKPVALQTIDIENILIENVSGYLNPYLCI